jgi:hypothetical protein
MTITTVENIYEEIVKRLSVSERMRLVEKIARDLSMPSGETNRYEWVSLRGIAPNLLSGADAQEWVSRSRQTADENREAQWRPHS